MRAMWRLCLAVALACAAPALSRAAPPDTGISGVYEIVIGAEDATPVLTQMAALGFRPVKEAALSEQQARRLYGVASAARVIRLQNGAIDSHGLARIIAWEKPLGPGVGYAPPETIGQRMAVMRTRDIFRIHDVFSDLRTVNKEPWLVTQPVYDARFGMRSDQKLTLAHRRSGVREMAVYGALMSFVFFQRYGYEIPGYGTIADAPLQTSEFTHHDFIVKGDLSVVTQYYEDVLGFKSEGDAALNGDYQDGPRVVFDMGPGVDHWYRGFVSPNNICGKLKFFSARDAGFVRDRSANQRLGELGITMHTLYTPRLDALHARVRAARLSATALEANEFGERSFVLRGPDGATWQILEAPTLTSPPVTVYQQRAVDN
jgi:hypothetical protein